MPTTTPTRIYGNWRYFRAGKYIYCWTTQRQPHYNSKYVSFVRRWHKTKSQYVTVDSKTATHASRSKARERAMRLAGMDVPTKTKKPVPVGKDEAYCMACKAPRKVDDLKEVERITKSGKVRHAIQGTCSECGSNVTKFVAKRRECPKCIRQLKDSDFPPNDYLCYDCRY